MNRTNTVLAFGLLAAMVGCGDDSATVAPTDEVIAAATNADVRGFVFTRWAHHIPRDDPGECPDGLNITEEEYLSEEYDAVRDEVKRRYQAGDREGALSLLPPDACKDPLIKPDPGHKTLDGPAAVAGIDLDGVHSTPAAGGQCAHDDFTGPNGERGIDNQHWRLYGSSGVTDRTACSIACSIPTTRFSKMAMPPCWRSSWSRAPGRTAGCRYSCSPARARSPPTPTGR